MSVPEMLPGTVKAPTASQVCTPKVLSPHQAADTTSALGVGETGSFDTERDHSAIATGREGVSNEVVALQEVILAQKEDLKTAALIGQRLLDANDELSAKLEVTRAYCLSLYLPCTALVNSVMNLCTVSQEVAA